MKKVRIGVVGVGGMGNAHCKFITQDNNKDFCVAAVADIDPAMAEKRGGEFNVPFFAGAQAMYDSGLIDAAIIATPHYWHAPLAIRAARAGLHVLVEKPMAVTVGAARAMIAECRRRRVALAVMFNCRTRGVMMKARQMIAAGALGEVYRIAAVCSNWYRPQKYYALGNWRGTWDGEGGGVLLNQAPHSLDLFQWLGGLPRTVIASVETRLHKIEVENTANAVCIYERGKVGYFYASTADAPGTEHWTICGDRGTLVIEGGKLRFGRLKRPISKDLFISDQLWQNPPCEWRDVTWTKEGDAKHIIVTRAFAAHILRGTPLVATGAEGINELELSNAIYLSGYERRPVDIPVDAPAMDRLLARLQRDRSTGRGGGQRQLAAAEMKRLMKK